MSTKAFGGWTHAGAGLLLVAGLVFCGIAAEGRLRRLGDGPGRRQRPRLPLADSHGTGGWPIHPHHQLSMARLRPRSSSRVSSLGAWPTSRPPRSISRRFSRPPRRLPCNCWRTAPPSRRRTEFGLNDSVTSFRVASDAFSGNGALGAGTVTIDSVEPFYLEPKLPLHVTVGDRIDLPLGIVNATSTSTPMHDVAVSIRTPKGVARGGDEPTAQIAANGRVRQMLPLLIREAGGGEISIAAHASGYSDKVIRTLTVHPRGLERLIQEPCGCFEQTSSTTYPLVMAQRYFKSHQAGRSRHARTHSCLAARAARWKRWLCPQDPHTPHLASRRRLRLGL